MIHEVKGHYVISSGGMWLPGFYEDARTARYAFRCSNKMLSELRDIAAKRGTPTSWGEIARALESDRKQKTSQK